jgi:hypothetical protein
VSPRLLVVLLIACGGGRSTIIDASQGDDDASVPSDGLTCAADKVVCDEVCVDLATDPMHCGSCANACPAALGACQNQICVPRLTTAWQVHFGAGGFPGFWFSSVASDAQGNVYVAGVMNFQIDLGGGLLAIPGGGGVADILVASFTPAGAHRWSRIFGSAALDSGDRLVLSGTTLYVLGTFQRTIDFGGGPLTSAGGEDIIVLGLDAGTGAYVSARRYGNAGDDEATAIAADASGNVIIGGAFRGASIDVGGGPIAGGGTLISGFLAAFSPAGAHLWSRSVATVPAGLNLAVPAGLAADAQGNVVVTGNFRGVADFGTGSKTAAATDAFVTSYSNTGALRWLRIFNGAGDDTGATVALDSTGAAYVGGTFHGPSADFGTGAVTTTATDDGYLVSLAGATGATRFARALGASMSSSLLEVHVAADGNVLATGSVGGTVNLGLGITSPVDAPPDSLDVYFASFSGTTGASRWGKRYGGRGYETGLAITSGPSGEILVTGQTFSNPIDLGTGPFALLGTADNGFVMKVVP